VCRRCDSIERRGLTRPPSGLPRGGTGYRVLVRGPGLAPVSGKSDARFVGPTWWWGESEAEMRLAQEDIRGRTGQSHRMAGPEIREGRRGGRMFASRSGLLRRAAAKRVLQFTGVRDELFNLLGTPNVVRDGGFRLGGRRNPRVLGHPQRRRVASVVREHGCATSGLGAARLQRRGIGGHPCRMGHQGSSRLRCSGGRWAAGPAQSTMLDTDVVWQRSHGGS